MGNSAEPQQLDNHVHPRLGPIKRVQANQTSQFISFQILIENQKMYEDWLKEVRVLQQEQEAQEILFLPLEHSFKQTAFCGTGGIASLRYEDYLYSLLPEIHNRREIKRPFNEQELLYLFYNLVKVSAALEAKHRVIGDIKPENILVNEDGYVKIICQYSWPGQPTKWQKPGQRLFLSPEQCQQKHKKRQPSSIPLHDSNSQAFSIGLTILQAGSLRDCAQLYQQGTEYRFNELKARDYLDTFQTRYSQQFTQMIKEMLHLNPKKRWKAKQIYNMLKLYEYQILNLQEISIRLDSSLFVPKVEREQKISIKRMGESHQSNIDHFSSKNSHIEQNSKPVMVSPQSLHYHSPSDHLRQRLSSNNVKTQQSSLQGLEASQRRHPQPPQKYHLGLPHHNLVNQFSNFGRQLAPNPQFTKSNHSGEFMGSSLPLRLSDLQASSIPQYLTQNSMVIPRPIQETNYFLTSPQGKFMRRE